MPKLPLFIMGATLLAGAIIGVAQTPEPSPTPVILSAESTPPPSDNGKEQAELAESIKQLQELKAQNDNILKQQQAALDTLDELEKAAEQIKIFSKRT